jgi:ribosome modulation factor
MSQQLDNEVLRDLQKRQAYDEGYDAYVDGLTQDDNPYENVESEWDLRDAWSDGWYNAAWDD